jgi:ribosomal protein S18 acetylase RimI-like enzyme
MEIRTATIDDLNYLVDLCQEVQQIHMGIHPETFKEIAPKELKDYFAYQLKSRQVLIFVACAENKPVGYLMTKIVKRSASIFSKPSKTLFVDQFGVSKNYRCKGIGKSLLQTAIDLAQANGIEIIELGVWNANAQALVAFSALGFNPVQTNMRLTVRSIEPSKQSQ